MNTEVNFKSKWFIGKLKNDAKNVYSVIDSIEKKKAEIAEKGKELKNLEHEYELRNAITKEQTGYNADELVDRVVTPTDKFKKVSWVLKYPDTVIPPVAVVTAAAVDNVQDPVNYASPVTTEEPEEYLTEKAEAEEAYHNSDDYAQVAADYSRTE